MDISKCKLLADKLEKWFNVLDKAAVAFSGGIDSSLVAFTARKYLGRENAIAVISISESLKSKDLIEARALCLQYDIVLKEIDPKEIENSDYANNPINRCFYCKTALYNEMEKLIVEEFPGYTVLNGSNYSDFGDFRPGLKAADQYKVLSPLAECKFTKEDIREVSKYYGLPNWDKPASPCLSSRFPYGEHITVEKLKMVEQAEDFLNGLGFNEVRVRIIGKSALIEVPTERIEELKEMSQEIEPKIKSIGFITSIVDEEGFVSGKLNRGVV